MSWLGLCVLTVVAFAIALTVFRCAWSAGRRRSRDAQTIAPWINAPDAAHLFIVELPGGADIIAFPTSGDPGGAA